MAGKGNKDGRNIVIEFKESRPSAYDLCRQCSLDKVAAVHADMLAHLEGICQPNAVQASGS